MGINFAVILVNDENGVLCTNEPLDSGLTIVLVLSFHYGKLFDLLRKRKLPAIVIRLLLDMYTRQRMRAVWNGSASESFSIENGVKQGGILSPILFCVYIDELLNCLIESKLGCHIGHVSYSALGYADDVGLLTPSVQALQDLLHICETFSEEFRVVYNSKKTTCMRIGSNGDPPARAVSLNGSPLTWTRRIKHLGNIITCDLKDSEDITFKKGAFISQVNRLNCKMSQVSGNVKGQLMQTYCCSWYGCQTWDLASKSACQMNTEWNKAVRRTLRVPYTTHTNLLPLLVKGKPFMTQHFSRVSKFVQSFVHSNNTSVVFIGALARYSSSGALGRNYTRCQNSACLEIPDTDLLARSHCIRELLDVRDGVIDIPGLDIDEVLTTINEICCNWFPLCIVCNIF